ncbi:hypothetical protein [Pseudodesulfovibrio senegalensis]|uniref:MobC family plasmid mobilization relaxosome protein n=1 Tax=Pseudodesulfovibrio senegalensis TaxID=1721087 RepID=A0A6N6MX00_9BACT|nr:hypothetical protein [Pseudodesulfovibrio senegalensis]KAB1437311.1 hypothetical protein F8A88_15405 [Pseudodesulfovibrio senegalensis]
MEKTRIVTFRITPEEDELIDSYLAEMQIPKRSPFLREAVFAYLNSDKPQLNRELFEELKAWRKDLRNVGINLNQTAYKLNADHPLSSSQIQEVLNDLQKQFAVLANSFWRLEDELR